MDVNTYNVKKLSGDRVSNGIQMSDGKFSFSGGPSRSDQILCYGTDKTISDYLSVNVGSKDNLWFLRPSSETPSTEMELVLVHEYAPGSGAKRWPGFWIDWENSESIQHLTTDSRSSGSGADQYSLVLAPIGWAENIASQFINERDYGSQTISYDPDFKKVEINYEVEENYDDDFDSCFEDTEEDNFIENDKPVIFDKNNPIHVTMREAGLM